MDSSSWSAPDHTHHQTQALHTATGGDDFHQFLDMNNIGDLSGALDFDFHDFAANHNPAHHAGHHAGDHLLHSSAGGDHLDTPMTGTDMSMILSPVDHAMLQQAQQQQHQMPTITTTAPYQNTPTTLIQPSTPSEAIVNTIDAQIQFLQQQKLHAQHQQLQEQQAAFFASQQNHIVPPTPQSLELTAGSSQNYYAQSTPADQHHPGRQQQQQPQQQRQQAIDYRYARIKDQHDMSFTPLVSPAVTPLETHFPIDTHFAVPGAYFSPLTSPALHAQNDSLGIIDQRLGMMSGNSPREMELEPPALSQASVSPGDLARKMRKNAVKARQKSNGGIKHSPIAKPIRRKTATTPMLNPQALNQLIENANAAPSQEREQPPPTPLIQTSSSSTAGVTDSENGSISPENLNDVVSPVEMPPPPLPKARSAKPSPYLAPQASSSAVPITLQPGRPGIASPATPASLMKLSSPSNRNPSAAGNGSHDPMDADHIENFELPDSINFSAPPKPAPIITTLGTPALDPLQKAPAHVQTPGLPPPPSPAVAKPLALPSAALPSPQLKPDSTNSLKRTPNLAPMGRHSKKRASVSSIQMSPALRPKISPSIKPLLPGGATGAEDAASLLLATKSNYQRILEGNTVPGVSYPSELSTNLTSKRTSHKIAEQGRRNRINSALQEIATLLPKAPAKEGRDGDGDGNNSSGGGGGGGGSGDADKEDKKEKDKDKAGGGIPNSKASTVEMAIEYIKQLQKEVAEANKRAEEAERKLGEMKSQGGTSMGSGSPGGDAGGTSTLTMEGTNSVMNGDLKLGGDDAMDE